MLNTPSHPSSRRCTGASRAAGLAASTVAMEQARRSHRLVRRTHNRSRANRRTGRSCDATMQRWSGHCLGPGRCGRRHASVPDRRSEASICNDGRAPYGVLGGHDRKTLGLSVELTARACAQSRRQWWQGNRRSYHAARRCPFANALDPGRHPTGKARTGNCSGSRRQPTFVSFPGGCLALHRRRSQARSAPRPCGGKWPPGCLMRADFDSPPPRSRCSTGSARRRPCGMRRSGRSSC
jgi:hypothetical protein